MSKRITRSLAIAVAAALATPALAGETAEGAGAVYTKETYPDALPARPLTLPSETFELTVPVTINLSQHEVGKPVGIGASLSYGVNQDLTLGLFSGPRLVPPLGVAVFGEPALGVCVTGESNGCAKVFNDLGAQALVNLYRNGDYQLAALGGLQFTQLSDPTLLQAQLGLAGKGTFGRAALAWSALFGLGLTNRDLGKKEALAVALQPQLEVAHGLAVSGLIGLVAPLDGFGDLYRIPVGAGVEVTPLHNIDVGADFEFENLLGKESGTEARVLRVYGRARF